MLISQDYASSKQLVYLASMPSWQGIGKISTRSKGIARPIYAFDLERHSEIPWLPEWMPLWASSYKDDFGRGVYKPLGTIFPISPYSQFLSSAVGYEVDIDCSPLIPLNTSGAAIDVEGYRGGVTCPYGSTSVNWGAEWLLFLMTVNLAYPLIVINTVPESSSTLRLGPIFADHIVFECEENSNVSIEARLAGNKFQRYGGDFEPLDQSEYENLYRSANFADCYCLFDEQNPFSGKNARLISMRLGMDQEIDKPVTCWKNMDAIGTRFAALSSRTVKGTLKFLAKSEHLAPELSERLIMYFGGPFYFNMSNVRWQRPVMSLRLKTGYVHTFDFIALPGDDVAISRSVDLANPIYSEFVVSDEEEEA